METLNPELIKGNCYSKEEIESFGCVYVKKTNIILFYRKDDTLYVFDLNCNKKKLFKLISVLKD